MSHLKDFPSMSEKKADLSIKTKVGCPLVLYPTIIQETEKAKEAVILMKTL